jgi:hypothetical protein
VMGAKTTALIEGDFTEPVMLKITAWDCACLCKTQLEPGEFAGRSVLASAGRAGMIPMCYPWTPERPSTRTAAAAVQMDWRCFTAEPCDGNIFQRDYVNRGLPVLIDVSEKQQNAESPCTDSIQFRPFLRRWVLTTKGLYPDWLRIVILFLMKKWTVLPGLLFEGYLNPVV